MRTLLTPLAAVGLVVSSCSTATGSSATPPGPTAGVDSHATATATASPDTKAPSLSADGKRFAKDTKYQGTCAPPGSRGGCYSFTFHPDGQAEHELLDATAHGTYRIEGHVVVFKMALPEAQEERYESTDGFRTLGSEYHYVP
jgi:hypothetical protein